MKPRPSRRSATFAILSVSALLLGSVSGSSGDVSSDTLVADEFKLTSSDAAAGDTFGISVSVSGDTALIGARLDDDAGSNSGSAYVFERIGGAWMEVAKLTASDETAGDNFGFTVSVSGETTLIGALFDDDAGPDSGSAYVFELRDATPAERISNLGLKIEALEASGDLSNGEATSLTNKLEQALRELERGDIPRAQDRILKFAEDVQKLIIRKKLPALLGQPLIDQANSIWDQLNAL